MIDRKRKGCVVLVDDQEPLLESFRQQFEGDFEVLTFSDAEVALAEIQKNPNVDVVISDEVMPNRIQGHDFLAKLRRSNPNIQRIITTGYTEKAALNSSYYEAKIHGFIKKPWESKRLRAMIIDAVESRRKTDEFLANLEASLEKWKGKVLVNRKKQIEYMLHLCGFEKIEGILQLHSTVLDQIGAKTSLEWVDAELFDEDAERTLIMGLMDTLVGLSRDLGSESLLTLKDIRQTLTKMVDVKIVGSDDLVIPDVTLLYSISRLTKGCSIKTAVVKILETNDQIAFELMADGPFGYGINDVLCGSEKATIMKNSWLMHVVAGVVIKGGEAEFQRSTTDLRGLINLPKD